MIVGAGAAGLAAAIFASEAAYRASADRRATRIVMLESAPSVGAKILISGGGRCNVAHCEVHPDDFNGSRNPIRNILAAFDVNATAAWFESMGVRLKREETGKLFPVSDRARTIVDALVGRCTQLGVRIHTGQRVADVTRLPAADAVDACNANGKRPGFAVHHARGHLVARRLIIATGGRSLPRTGSNGTGWEIVGRLGHSVTDTHPALVPLKLDKGMFHAELSGLPAIVELSIVSDGKLVHRRGGSMLWTHFGISGPAVMDASRHWIAARSKSPPATVRMLCNFMPGHSHEECEEWLLNAAAAHPRMALCNLLSRRISERLNAALARYCGIDPAIPAGQLPREQRRKLMQALTSFELLIMGDRGWNFAEVTAGGVPLAEIDYRTMESRRVPGLYLVGEMLDCDGRIGGFNFQWAWATGYLAGRAAALLRRPAGDQK
ncbi:MAG: NAD(P)/FAD-dependent oxidoreductase [Candidatus Binataceae bacterium]